MSTLTSSPSLTTSPSSYHIQRSSVSYNAPSSSISTSTGPSPKTRWPSVVSTSTSPRRAFNAPSSFPSSATSKAGTSLPRAHYIESPAVEKTGKYVDAGTQYSPEGYPPTAARSNLPTARAPVQHHTSATHGTPNSAGKKRKDLDSPEPMSTSGGSSAPSSGRAPPPEPEPRRDPSAPQSGVIAVPSRKPDSEEPEAVRSTHGHSSAPKRSKPESGVSKVMPILYQHCNAKELGHLISNMLMELIRLNDRIPLRDGRLTRFHSRAPPGISVSDYLQRLIHHATLSPPIMLSMVYYIDRLCQLYPIFTINSLTVHRFLITAATVAAKGLSDSFWTNPTYARIGGIPVSELATLELEFLEKVQWKIVPKPEVLEDYYRSLVERTEGYVLEGREGSEQEGTSESTSLEESEEGDDENDGGGNREGDGDAAMTDEPT